MIKLIIKNPDGSQTTKEITQDTTLSPSKGQQFYFDNTDGSRKHTFNLADGEESVELIFAGNGERLVINLKGMAELIKQSDNAVNENTKTVIGIMDDNDGMKELNETALNNEFQGDKVISDLKELLSDTTNPDEDYQNGIIIDDFGSLLERLDAAAAGGELGQNSGANSGIIDPSGQAYGVDARGRGLTVDRGEPNGEVDAGEEDSNPLLIIGDGRIVYEAGLDHGSNPGDSDIVSGTFRIESPDGISIVTIGGREFTVDQLLATNTTDSTGINTGEGTLVIDGYTEVSAGVSVVSFTYTLTTNLDHNDELADGDSSNNDANTVSDFIAISVRDADGDTASGQLEINIIDDVPSIDVYVDQESEGGEPELIVDETDLSTNASANFAYNFNSHSHPGADGEKSHDIKYTLDVKAADADTGLIDIATGEKVLLTNNAGVIEGRTETTGLLVFTVSVDSTGTVTLDQIRALTHPDATNPDDSVSLASDDLVTLTRTDVITDNDEDTAEDDATLNIGANLIFKDDGPTVEAKPGVTADVDLDETTDMTAGTGLGVPAIISATDISGLFGPIDYGADGAGTVEYSLSATSLVGTGLFLSGADESVPANEIKLVVTADGYAGYVNGDVTTPAVFTVEIDSVTGKVTVTQNAAMEHSDDGSTAISHNDTNTPLDLDGLIKVEQKVTDKDGDSDSAISESALDIEFYDDGPTAGLTALAETSKTDANNIILAVDETEGAQTDPTDNDGASSSKADFSSLFSTVTVNGSTSADFGADGAGSVAYSLSLTNSAGTITTLGSGLYALDASDTVATPGDGIGQGDEIIMTVNAVTGDIEGKANGEVYFTISTDANGVVTFTQAKNIWNSDTNDHNDAEGIALSQLNSDDVSIVLTQTVTDADGDTASASVKLVSSEDTADVAQFNILDDGPSAGLTDAEVEKAQANEIALTVDESALQQANPADTDADRVSSADFTSLFKVVGVGGVTATDLYGTDGAGSVDYSLSLTNATGTTVGGVQSGLFALGVNGAKGAEILLSEVNGSIVGTAGGVTYFTISNTGTNVTFTQSENVWHSNTADHDDTESLVLGQLNQVDVSINLTQTVTDADGDTDTSTVALVSSDTTVDVGAFNIKDDGPTASVVDANYNTTAATLDESAKDDPNTVAVEGDGVYTASVNVAAAFSTGTATAGSYGTDGAGSTTYNLTLKTENIGSGLYILDPSNTTAGEVGKGEEIELVTKAGVITGIVASTGDEVFTVKIDATTGNLTFEYVDTVNPDNIWHDQSPANDGDNTEALTTSTANTLVVTQTITDADGDSATSGDLDVANGKFFKIEDDGPTAASPDINLLESNQFTITNHDDVSSAGYHNSYGYYLKDPVTGEPTTGVIVWDDVHDSDTVPVTVTGYTQDQVGFFIIPNGENKNTNLNDNTEVTFVKNADGQWQAEITSSGTPIVGQGSHVLFDEDSLNKDNQDHVEDNALIGNQNWEDLQIPNGDGDFNDVNVNVQWTTTAILDESELPLTDDGIYSATVDVSSAFSGTAAGSYGTDGAGTTTFNLELNLISPATNVGSGLYILDNTQVDGKGAEILLVDNGDGTVSGIDGTDKVFTISIDSSGALTIAYDDQVDPANIWNANTTDSDDASVLQTTIANTLVVTQTITDADGDSATSDGLDVGNGKFFKIEDDGPEAGLTDAEVEKAQANEIALTVDESALQQANPADTDADRVSSADFTSLFKVVGVGGVTATDLYGTDGAGSVDYSLSLTNATGTTVGGVQSGLFALGVNGAKGAEILLSEVNGSIVGTAGGVTYFTISNTGTNVTFTQSENVWHSNTADHDDTESLVLGQLNQVDVSINLTQTVTDADGDTDTSTVALVSSDTTVDVGAFNIKDDGPTVDVTANPEIKTLILEESFENFRTGNGWHVEHGGGDINGQDNSTDTTITGDHGVVWDLNAEGVEIQKNIVTTSDDGSSHAELDPHDFDGQDGNTVMTTPVTLIGSDSYELSFAYQPRPSDKESSDMKVTFGGKELTIDSDSNGVLTITTNPSDNTVQYTTTTDANGWVTIDVVYSGITGTTADLTFEGLADSNKLGALIDDISLTGVSGGVEPTLVVDETNLNIDNSASFAGLFSATKDAGTDGEQSHDIDYSLDVKSSNVDSGLVDTATGDNVLLKVDAGQVVGYVTIAGVETTVFTVSVDNVGNVTLDQKRAVIHPDVTDHDDAVNLSADDLVTLTRTDTVTDNDGDTATDSDTINIGANLTFKDDGPLIDAVANNESLVTLTTQDAQTEGAAFDTDTTSANFGGVFASTGANYGEDGAGNIDVDNYNLSVKNANSGLTSGGVAITLSLVNGEVVGTAGTTDVFKVSVDASGKVTLTQYEVLDHPNTNSNSEIISLVNGKIELSADVTITDKDGDTASDSAIVDLGGNLRFQDDGPVINIDKTTAAEPNLTVDETNIAISDKANFASMFTVVTSDAGADGEDASKSSTEYTLDVKAANTDTGLIDTRSGEKVLLTENASGVVEGRTETGGLLVFTVTVNATTGEVTLDQQRALSHPDAANPDDTVSLTSDDLVTLTRTDVLVDNDGDTDTDSVKLDIGKNLLFKDDGPAVDVKKTAITEPTLTVDETNLSINDNANFAAMFTVKEQAGEDEKDASKSSTKYTLDVKADGADSGLVDVATSEKVVLTDNAGVIEGRTETGGLLVFTVSIDESTAEVTLDQQRALKHPIAGDNTNNEHDDSVTLNADDLVTLTRTDIITDNDGDTATDSESIEIGTNLTFKDDGPTVDISSKDDSRVILRTDDVDTKGTASDVETSSYNFGQTFQSSPGSITGGADGIAKTETEYKLSAVDGTDSGLTSHGVTIVLNVINGEVIGTAGSTEIFKVSVVESGNDAGEVTLTQSEAIDHVDENADNDATNNDANLATLVDNLIKLSATVTVTDKDGDTASDTETINIGSNLQFTDDTPSSSDSAASLDATAGPVNLVFTLDISGSMGSGVSGTGQDRLEVAIDAMEELVAKYESLGSDVLIQVNTFNATASGDGSWMTSSQLETFLNTLNHSGLTNYEDALEETEDNYSLSPNGGDTYVYFLSDGNPTTEINDGAAEESGYLDSARVADWNTFVNNPGNEIDKVFSIGIGSSVSTTYLAQVSADYLEVADPAKLSDTLQGTVVTATGSLTFDFGADGAADGTGVKLDGGKLAFTWGDGDSTNALSEITTTGTNGAITWTITDGTVLVGTINGETVIKVEATGINTANPEYSISQFDKDAGITGVTIPFTVTDADGDSSSSNLNVSVDSSPTVLGDDNTVYEKGLTSVPDTSEIATGTFKVTSPDGIARVTIGGVVFTEAQLEAIHNTTTPSSPINTGEGSLLITDYDQSTGEISYEYTLTATIDNDSKPGATDTEFVDNITLELEDSDGDTTNGTLKITIVDDVPVAQDDLTTTLVEDTATTKVEGQVLTNDESGADAPEAFVSWNIAGDPDVAELNTYGTLKLNADGTYEFVLDNSLAKVQALKTTDLKTFNFEYTMKDADGDEDTAVLTIKIQGAKDGADVETAKATGADDVVYEAGLSPDGTESATDKEIATNTFDISTTDGIKNIVVGGDTFTIAEIKALASTNQTVDTGEGTLKLTGFTGDDFGGTVSYEYTLKATIDNDSKAGATDTKFDDKLDITVNGISGTTATDELIVRIMDDAPEANDDTTATLVEDAAVTKVEGQVLTNDISGADAPKAFVSWDTVGDADVAELNTYGTLKLNADGTYEFVLDNTLAKVQALTDTDLKTFTFNYTMEDADGDEDTAVLTIKIQGYTEVPPTLVVEGAEVDEDFIPNVGNETDPDTDAVANQHEDSGNINVTNADDVVFKAGQTTTLTSESQAISLDYSNGDKTITGTSNGEVVFVATIAANGKSYSFELMGQLDHPVMDSEDTVNLPLIIEASNNDGKVTDTLNVTIADDIPSAGDATATIDLNTDPVNLVFTLDISGSMNDIVAGTGKDKLEIAIESIEELVAKYESLGSDVLIQVNTFNASASGTGDWMTSSELTTFLNGLNHSGLTNYEDALKETEDNYTLSPNGGDTYVYFLSDGNPTTEIDDGSNEESGYLDSARVTKWNDFVNDPVKDIDKVFAVGIGTSVSTTYLSQVSADVVEVDDPADLSTTLQDTVVFETGSLDFNFGADGEADGTDPKLDGDKLAFTWETPTATDALGNTVAVTWTVTEEGKVLTGTVNGEIVAKIEAKDVLSDTPKYEITQLDKSSGITDLNVPFTVTDGDGDSTTANLDIDINIPVDTQPSSYGEINTVQLGDTTTNLVITFDVSGSMGGDKLALAKTATNNMIDKYDDLGDVKIMLTSFGNYGQTLTGTGGTVWLTVSEAKAYINGFSAGGGTNYDDALLDVTAAMASEQVPASDQLISYFVSDGNPTYGMADNDNNGSYETRTGNGSNTQGVTDAIANTFKALPFTETYSVGIGSASLRPYLEEIAVDGASDVVIVQNASDLDATLQNSVSASVSGNVADNIDYDVDGAGGIVSIKVDGVDYTNSFTDKVTSEGGKLSFNITDGSYTYKAASSNFNSDTEEVFEVKAQDADGDVTKFDLTIKVDVTPHETENIVDLADTDTIDLSSVLTNHSTTAVDGVDMTDGKANNLNIDLSDIVILDDDPELDELKIFGENGDKVTLEGGDSNWTNSGKTEIDGEVFNVYEGTNGTSNIKVLIDEDVSIEPDL